MACDEYEVVTFDSAEGHRHDAKISKPVLAEAKASVGQVVEVLGDKGFVTVAICGVILVDLDALPVIPNKVNRKAHLMWDEQMHEDYEGRTGSSAASVRPSSSGASPRGLKCSRMSTPVWYG
ncbi:hypothetical protein P12x_003409 [Tundrisphaera lichenicola]|uniref:hypothetical protein n=1 Tax=Tundrisphaera lichenicola TaxID=2029860 RepID=UPI003EBEDA27